MKKLLCLCILLLGRTAAVAGTDSVYVQIQNDTVTIWNVGAVENCCIGMVSTAKILNDSIIVLEHDTATAYCRCTCTFDFSVSLTGLQSGTYHASVYRHYTAYSPESLYYIGGTSFAYGGGISGEVTSTAYQSGCYNPPVPVGAETDRMPAVPTLSQNYPNPFNPVTIIRYQVTRRDLVTIKIYDLLGREKATLVDGMKNPGNYEVQFDGVNLPAGAYYYRLMAGGIIQTKKILLVK